MDPAVARAILVHLGLIAGVPGAGPPRAFTRGDGTLSRVERHADILHAGPLPPADAPLIVQVSRWDRLKDMVGVLRGFADYALERCDATLLLVGPNVHGVTDDPEGAATYEQCVGIWRGLPHFQRAQLVSLPMTDVEENAAIC
jgi:trehalose synthase